MRHFILFILAKVTLQLAQSEPNNLSNADLASKQLMELANLDVLNNNTDHLDQSSKYKFSHGSPKEIKKYLWNAIITSCLGDLPEGQVCMCPSIYEETKIVEDTEKASLSVVTVNKMFKQIVVSYRASVVLKNWEASLDMKLVDADFIDGVKVHRGFLEYYKTLRSGTHAAVVKLFDQPQYSNYTLHVTGGSLGGSISTISAIDWINLLRKRKDNRKIEIYNYSGPRVGDQAFVDSLGSYNVPVTGFASNNDAVPHIPPRMWEYVHAGTELYYDPAVIRVHVCRQDVYEDSTCSQSYYAISRGTLEACTCSARMSTILKLLLFIVLNLLCFL